MGIPGLSKPLETYAVSTIIGCKTLGCEKHPPRNGQHSKIVIDGPSFAYCIYQRLIRGKPDWLTAVEIIPSYDEVGKAALAFLDELESYGAIIEGIYFDGYLPPRKRSVRAERLKTSLRKLSEYRQKYCNTSICKKRKWDGQPLPTSVVLQSGPHTTNLLRGIPPAAFIVPAVLDAISGSKYAAICMVVPGEAEVYCAVAAKGSGAIILSNDSDLFIHDLGSNGAFVYLSSAELRPCEETNDSIRKNPCQTIRFSVFRPRDIAERLGFENLQQLAFEFKKRLSQTLPEALEAAKRHQGREQEDFQSFLEEYVTEPSVSERQQFSPEALARFTNHPGLLDPRISEVVSQLESKDQQIAHAYLLYLIEDPARSSAWLVSSSHRYFAYSIYNLWKYNDQTEDPDTVIVEHTRRGPNFSAQAVPLLSHSAILDYASRLHGQLHRYAAQFAALSPPLVWRLYALAQVYHWYLDTRRTPPSRATLTHAMTGDCGPRATWDDIHLSAQIQALLYSLRTIKQMLAYTAAAPASSPQQPGALRDLAAALDHLPPIALLMPSSFELAAQTADVDMGDVLNTLAAMLQREAGGGSADRLPRSRGSDRDDAHGEPDAPPLKKSRKGSRKEKKKKKKKKKKGKAES